MPPAPLRLLIDLTSPALVAACRIGRNRSAPFSMTVGPHRDPATAFDARSLRRHDGKMSLCVDIRLGCQGE